MKYCQYVNIKQGSESVHRFSNGNTLPLVQLPFGMVSFAPQTGSENSWFYHPKARSLEGVRLTHQPSPWIADYGNVIFMPQSREPKFSAGARWSGYRPEDAVLTPYYMKLRFLKSRCDFELTPTERCCHIRLRFDSETENYFSVLPLKGNASFRFDEQDSVLYAAVHNVSGGKAENFTNYIVVKFIPGQINAESCIVGTDDKKVNGNRISGENVGIHIKITGDKLDAVSASSYIGFEQAFTSLEREIGNKSFDTVKSDAENIWEQTLSRMEAECYTEKQMRTFYSCLYRAFLYPHKCYEINNDGKEVHYSPFDGKVHPGVRYTDNGFWDTYRTVYPFFSLVAKKEYEEMCRGFICDYTEGGWLPRWPSIGERGCMPSTLIDAVLCDAAVKNIIDKETVATALEGMLKHSVTNAEEDDYGRNGAEEYTELGYVPIEAHRESVNLTLDAAYGDWCIARMAALTGQTDITEIYDKRALNYKNLFDSETGFMRAKYKDGSFRRAFSPFAWGKDYTEGSAWQNSFAVPHDIEGLAQLYGGKDKLMTKIDELFATPPLYEDSAYGCEIHEMTEMAAADFGQCAISNQPSFHIPYIYAALGDVDKTAYWVKKICEEAFSYEDDGFPGDEDNGSMALWYVFSNIGIYPFTPGKKEFVRTKRLVKSVRIAGKQFDADAFEGNIIPYSVFCE